MTLISKKFLAIFLLIPLFLITGPAIPDIIITSGVIFGIYYVIRQRTYKDFNNINLYKISLLLWISFIFISFFHIIKYIHFKTLLFLSDFY